MKKFIFIPVLMVILFTLAGCNLISSNEKTSLEMVAYSSLTDEEQDLIPVSPKDSIVEKVSVNEENESYMYSNAGHDHVYAVTFNHTGTDTMGDLVVYVDLDNETVVGKGFTRR
ncbi:lipoprotein [Paenibacillus provencensis]|uniref:Lipoprotein n=1 Tax=Paenibacillus provencensis TaxID=441151 RepID=A0ABW3PRS6_9BACL|nr:hypothetical protein [Paenibacillus sp. MER 78]MCM3127501.1 hypothetical protein [Paenibacillus sp. MER 78]